MNKLGDYEVHLNKAGFSSIRQLSSGEIMHSVIPPEIEARTLYVEPAQLSLRMKSESQLVIWDVGLGAASNAMAVIEYINNLSSVPSKVEIVSFENDLDSLKLAMKNPDAFPHLTHPAPHHLLNHNSWSDEKVLNWKLLLGDFLQLFEAAPKPHVIFYDLYSAKSNPPFWTLDLFQRMYRHCEGTPVMFVTYSASTAVRATMMAAGFYVGYGPSSGPKATTTMAYNDLALTQQLEAKLLGPEWLNLWERSGARMPGSLPPDEVEQFEYKIRNHTQFSVK
ncbi:MAG: MnmC family methyltransferase [Bdellovibrionota bacterium]